MKRIFIILVTMIIMTVSLFTPGIAFSVSADEESKTTEDVKRSVKTVITSIDELDGVIVMGAEEKAVLTDIFTDFFDVFKTIGSIIAPINGAVSFLRMIGVMKDPTSSTLANIQTQLKDVSDKLTNMDKKLDEIATAMSRLEATEEFHFRATQAQLFRQNWNTFRSTYMEKGIDELMRQYNADLTDAWKKWFVSVDQSQPDSDSIVVWYKCTNPSETDLHFELQNTLMNDFDGNNERSAEHNDRYTLYANEFNTNYDMLIALTGDFFDGARSIVYNVNTYRSDLKAYIKDKIRQDFGKEGVTNIRTWNINAASVENMLDEIADQAIDMITYKLSSKTINVSADFPSAVLNSYNLYCSHLLTASEGIDALLKTMYFTHCFEYEIKNELQNLINMFSLQTGVYSAFVANVIAMSDSITNDDKNKFTTKMCETLDAIAAYKKTAITGEDRYCYLTNSVIDYGNMYIGSSSSVDWYNRFTTYGYKGCKDGEIYEHVYDSSGNQRDASMIIGDSSALLMSYMVKSSGKTLDHDYMNEHLTVNKQDNYNGLVSNYRGVDSLTKDSEVKLSTYNVIGKYFNGNPDVYLSSLPSDAEFGYVNLNRMATGTLFNGASSSMQVNRPLLATAVYGENHPLWIVDESAFMVGPKDTGSLSYDVKQVTTYHDGDLSYYETTIFEKIYYNTLISIPLQNNEALDDENSPLNLFYDFLDKAIAKRDADHVHTWDQGTIIREASDELPGIIEYRCLDENDHAYFYTRLFDNYEMAELTFDLDGGKLDCFDSKLTRQFRIGSEINLPKAPEKDGYTFQYWSESDHLADSSYKVTGDRTFKAVWVKSKEYLLDSATDKEWYNGSRNVPYIRIIRNEDSKATLSHFKEVRMDEVVVDRSCYELSEGSLILKFNSSFLKNKPSGSHLVEVLFDDGKVEFILNIRNGLPNNGTTREYRLPITGVE